MCNTLSLAIDFHSSLSHVAENYDREPPRDKNGIVFYCGYNVKCFDSIDLECVGTNRIYEGFRSLDNRGIAILDHLKCALCKGIMKDPVQLIECSNRTCKICIEEYLFTEIKKITGDKKNIPYNDELKKIVVDCPFKHDYRHQIFYQPDGYAGYSVDYIYNKCIERLKIKKCPAVLNTYNGSCIIPHWEKYRSNEIITHLEDKHGIKVSSESYFDYLRCKHNIEVEKKKEQVHKDAESCLLEQLVRLGINGDDAIKAQKAIISGDLSNVTFTYP